MWVKSLPVGARVVWSGRVGLYGRPPSPLQDGEPIEGSHLRRQRISMPELKEEYDYNHEPELDVHTRTAHKNRSRYFFAMISFLAALLFLSVYLNNYLNLLSVWLILLGIFVFGAIGVFFLWPVSLLKNQPINSGMDYQGSKVEESMIE